MLGYKGRGAGSRGRRTAAEKPGKSKRTPQQARAKATVDRIIRAATQIVEQDGYAALTTNAVARRARVGVASVYEYFDDKDEVLVAALERELAALWLRLEERLPGLLGGDLETALRELFTFAVREVTRRSNLVRVGAAYVHGATDLPAGVHFLGQIEMLFRLLMKQYGRGAAGNVQLGAYLVTHAVLGICTGVAAGLPPGAAPEDVVEWLIHVARAVVEA